MGRSLPTCSVRMGNRAEALDALRRAVELNPANKRQLPLNEVFAHFTTLRSSSGWSSSTRIRKCGESG